MSRLERLSNSTTIISIDITYPYSNGVDTDCNGLIYKYITYIVQHRVVDITFAL
ncbi:hypothetical protein PANI_CDS0001 [Maribacter phage Panino]